MCARQDALALGEAKLFRVSDASGEIVMMEVPPERRLAPGWTAQLDEDSKTYFYVNEEGQAVWEKPEDASDVRCRVV